MTNESPLKQEQAFYGTTTLGERGQVVVPAEARTALKLKAGEKLLVFGMGNSMLAIVKLDQIAKFEKHLTQRLAAIRSAVKSAKKTS